MQLLSDVQMLHLRARKTTPLPTRFPPNSGLRASEPDLLSAWCRPPFSSTAGPQQGNPGHLTQSNGSQLSTQKWRHSSVNMSLAHFNIHSTRATDPRGCTALGQWEEKWTQGRWWKGLNIRPRRLFERGMFSSTRGWGQINICKYMYGCDIHLRMFWFSPVTLLERGAGSTFGPRGSGGLGPRDMPRFQGPLLPTTQCRVPGKALPGGAGHSGS